MKKINGFWVDDSNNRWDGDLFTEKQAEKLSLTLKNCKNGILRPNKKEQWLDVQAKALFQAENLTRTQF